MSRTKKDMPRKIRNYHAVNAHFRRSGPMVDRKKEQDKYATRASRTNEDYKHSEEFEERLEWDQHMFELDERDANLCGSIVKGVAQYGSRNTYFEFNNGAILSISSSESPHSLGDKYPVIYRVVGIALPARYNNSSVTGKPLESILGPRISFLKFSIIDHLNV